MIGDEIVSRVLNNFEQQKAMLIISLLLVLVVVVVCFVVKSLMVRRTAGKSSAQGHGQSLYCMLGPRAWPVVGNALMIDSCFPHLSLNKWAHQYGSVYLIHLGDEPCVVVSDYETIHDVLVTRGATFAGRTVKYRHSYVTFDCKDIFFGSPAQPWWSDLRKATHRAIRQFGDGLTKIDSALCDLVQETIGKMREKQGEAVDVRDDVYELSMKSIFILLTGVKPQDGDVIYEKVKAFERLVVTNSGLGKGTELDLFPWLRFLGSKVFQQLTSAIQLRQELWEELWANISTRKGEGCDDRCLLEELASLAHPSSPHYRADIDGEILMATLSDILVAGVTSSTSTMYAMLHIVMRHPAVLKRLQTECDVTEQSVGPYTRAVIYEILRYTSVTPAFPHSAMHDTTIGQYHVPAGTTVLPLFWTLHHDPTFWGDPWNFRPERFLDDQGALLPAHAPCRRHLMPFGAGPRVCLGEVFATKRLTIFLTHVVRAFDLHPPSCDQLTSYDPRTYLTGVVLTPNAYTIRLVTR